MKWNDRKLSGLNVDPDKTLMREKTEQGVHCLTLHLCALDTLFYGKTKSFKFKDNWATAWQNQQNECAPSEDSDQPS